MSGRHGFFERFFSYIFNSFSYLDFSRHIAEHFELAVEAREDYGEDLRKAICYVNGGGAIATASGGTLLGGFDTAAA